MDRKRTRELPWQAEFDLLDAKTQVRVNTRERARHVAAKRAGQLPSPAANRPQKEHAESTDPMLPLTRHAAHRMKNRGITLKQVLLVTDFGQPQRVHGATRYALDKQARQLVEKMLPHEELRQLRSLDIVAVVADDGYLITAAHRTGRLRRDLH